MEYADIRTPVATSCDLHIASVGQLGLMEYCDIAYRMTAVQGDMNFLPPSSSYDPAAEEVYSMGSETMLVRIGNDIVQLPTDFCEYLILEAAEQSITLEEAYEQELSASRRIRDLLPSFADAAESATFASPHTEYLEAE